MVIGWKGWAQAAPVRVGARSNVGWQWLADSPWAKVELKQSSNKCQSWRITVGGCGGDLLVRGDLNNRLEQREKKDKGRQELDF